MQILNGASTQSRQIGFRTFPGGRPNSAVRAEGCYLFLEDGWKILDWTGGLHGPVYGYDPLWLREVLARVIMDGEGVVTGYAPAVEAGVARLLGDAINRDLAVKFAKNGSDVCSAAVRLARAVTGRDKIATSGYHGFGESFVHAPLGRGVPQCLANLRADFAWLDEEGLRAAARDAACVIVEVPPVEEEMVSGMFLRKCAQEARENGALFIMDEIVTGFRYALGGASQAYGIMPDLYCWGKALSNGHALAALAGPVELMREFQNGVFFSATFFDDPLSLHAARATLAHLIPEAERVYPHLWRLARDFRDGFNRLAEGAKCVGQGGRLVLQFDDAERQKQFNQICLRYGILFDRPLYTNYAMTYTNLLQSLQVAWAAFEEMRRV